MVIKRQLDTDVEQEQAKVRQSLWAYYTQVGHSIYKLVDYVSEALARQYQMNAALREEIRQYRREELRSSYVITHGSKILAATSRRVQLADALRELQLHPDGSVLCRVLGIKGGANVGPREVNTILYRMQWPELLRIARRIGHKAPWSYKDSHRRRYPARTRFVRTRRPFRIVGGRTNPNHNQSTLLTRRGQGSLSTIRRVSKRLTVLTVALAKRFHLPR